MKKQRKKSAVEIPSWYSKVMEELEKARQRYPNHIIVLHSASGKVALRGKNIENIVAQMNKCHFDTVPIISCPDESMYPQIYSLRIEGSPVFLNKKMTDAMTGQDTSGSASSTNKKSRQKRK